MARKICFISLMWALLSAAALAAANYSWTEIVVPGKTVANAFGPNDKGQVAVTTSDGVSGIYKQGIFTPLPAAPAGFTVRANGINNAGTIVGTAIDLGGHEQGFILVNGTYTLFSRPGWENTEPRGIGNSGLVTGWSFQDTLANAGFVYDPASGTFTDVTPAGSTHTIAQGINRFGRISGDGRQVIGRYGFVWQQAAFNPGPHQLEAFLERLSLNGSTTAARGINDWGVVVGFTSSPSVGFVGSSFVGYQTLVPPGGDVAGFSTFCEGINNAGQVVCLVSDDNTGDTHGAFIGTPQL